MAKTLIRRANPSDFLTLLSIDEVVFPRGIAYDSNELFYFMNRKGAETLVLEHGGAIAGFLILEIHRSGKTATMVTLDVLPEYRRVGNASSLVGRSEEILLDRGVESYELQVDTSNAGAIRFYRKHGFETTRTLPCYYSNGHDAFQMVKRLRPAGER